jgi:D-alanyl-D-alanine dipeptidase
MCRFSPEAKVQTYANMKSIQVILLALCCTLIACQQGPSDTPPPAQTDTNQPTVDTSSQDTLPLHSGYQLKTFPSAGANDTAWVDLGLERPDILQDIRYASTNNFMKLQIYDCGRCLLRAKVARRVIDAHDELQKEGLGLKMFDCYRPLPAQQKLWDKMPDARYVTPPSKGSYHNRGSAVDLTIVDSLGRELDMGTDFDFFGSKAYHTYTDLPQQVLDNRKRLLQLMQARGFSPTRTEWWHYALYDKRLPLSSMTWDCKPNL